MSSLERVFVVLPILLFLFAGCGGGGVGGGTVPDDGMPMKVGVVVWSESNCSSDAQIMFLANRFSFVQMGAAVRRDLVDRVHACNPDITILGYINSTHAHYPSARLAEVEALDDPEVFTYAEGDPHTQEYRIQSVAFREYLIDVSHAAWSPLVVKWANEDAHKHFDGVFLDCAAPTLAPNYHTAFPSGYTDEGWAGDMIALLTDLRHEYADLVVYNGLHRDEDLTHMAHTDGGLIEGFVFSSTIQHLDLARVHSCITRLIDAGKTGKLVAVCAKSYIADMQKRMFAVACYMLGCGDTSVYNFMDLDNQFSAPLQYYPEYEIDLGRPVDHPDTIEDMFDADYKVLVRRFENGLVIVNPQDADCIGYPLDGTCYEVVPRGGGVIGPDGTYDGMLFYEEVSGSVTIPAGSAVILATHPGSGVFRPPS